MDEFRFRDLCGRFATGVTVVTAFDGDDRPVGMTVNSFSSVSLTPPLVAVAIEHEASAFVALRDAAHWTANILASHQEVLSRRFAALTAERFVGIGWQRGPEGQLLLDGTLAHLHCSRWQAVEAGDHTLLIGQVLSGEVSDHGRPLLFYRGGYGHPEGG